VPVKSFLIKLIILSGILLGLPFLGVMLAGLPVQRYLEFPPETQYIDHAPFSWIVFTGYSLFILAVILPIFIKILKKGTKVSPKPAGFYPFPSIVSLRSIICVNEKRNRDQIIIH